MIKSIKLWWVEKQIKKVEYKMDYHFDNGGALHGYYVLVKKRKELIKKRKQLSRG